MIVHINLTAVLSLVLFLIFLYLLNVILYKPLLVVFQQRTDRIAAGAQAAEQSRLALELAQKDIAEELRRARQQSQELLAVAIREAGAHRKQLIDEAHAKADVITAEARASIQAEYQFAADALRAQTASLGILIAEKAVGIDINSPEASRVASEVVNGSLVAAASGS